MKKASVLRRKEERKLEALQKEKEREEAEFQRLKEIKDREEAIQLEKERAIADALRRKEEDVIAKDRIILQRFAFQKQLQEQAGQKMISNFRRGGDQSAFLPLNYRGKDLQSQAECHAEYLLRSKGLD